MTNRALIAAYFASHPTVDKLFFTADEQCFFEQQFADSHVNDHRHNGGKGLVDKTITPYERKEVSTWEEYKATQGNAEQTPAKKPFAKMNKKELLAEMAERGLEAADKATNADLIKQIEEHDQAASQDGDGSK